MMANGVDPGRATIVRLYILGAGEIVRLDDFYGDCLVVLQNAMLGQTQNEIDLDIAAGVNFGEIQLGPLARLVGVWAGSVAGGEVMVIGR